MVKCDDIIVKSGGGKKRFLQPIIYSKEWLHSPQRGGPGQRTEMVVEEVLEIQMPGKV